MAKNVEDIQVIIFDVCETINKASSTTRKILALKESQNTKMQQATSFNDNFVETFIKKMKNMNDNMKLK